MFLKRHYNSDLIKTYFMKFGHKGNYVSLII